MTDTLDRLLEPGSQPPSRADRKRKKKGRVGNVILTSLAVVLLTGGLALGAGALFAPQGVERVYGAIKVNVQEQVIKTQEQVFDNHPTISLGASGGQTELDWCDGNFIEMLSYERDGVPPVWSAHNNCGGDVILPWEEGQRLQIEGDDTVYEIVDIRYTSKIWSTTADLVGIEGELALQTCFYGEDRMKFIGLQPVEDA